MTDGDVLELEKQDVGKEDDPASLTAAPTLQRTSLSQALRISTIDNFQGEEAKVVVISLVRSNDENKCGFLNNSNRINVLLSRAKHAMYIIGNSRTSGQVPMWADVIQMLHEDDNIGTSLDIQCPRHPEQSFPVSKPDDFNIYSPEGGCNLPCASCLTCGHACTSKVSVHALNMFVRVLANSYLQCHSDTLHNAVKCLQPCPHLLEECGHVCRNL